LVVLVFLCACAPWSPRFGHLQTGERRFTFEHGIEIFEAKNGLRVALLPDSRTNLVTVDVRYGVGAAEDPDGRRGMAHLVEHLTFLTRAAAGGPTIGDRLGDDALSFNAWTNADETNYTSTGFGGRLDAILEVEALRMSATCDQIDDALYLRERDVVLEEEAQRHGPLDQSMSDILATVWGKDHPYVAGANSREVADATREEACAFMTSHYGPEHAILVITGDIDRDAIGAVIAKRFGPVARRGDAPRAPLHAAVFDGQRTVHIADVDEATAIVFFPAPPWGSEKVAPFMVAAAYLKSAIEAAGEDWIEGVGITVGGGKRERMLAVLVSVDDTGRLEDAVDLIYDKAAWLVDRKAWSGWTPVVTRLGSEYVAAYDSFGARGEMIADYLQYTDHDWFFLKEMAAFGSLVRAEVQLWVEHNLTREHSHVAYVKPSGETSREVRISVTSQARSHDVAPWRTPVDPAEASRPLVPDTQRVAAEVSDFTLGNGLRVLLAPDPESAVVEARFLFPVGTAADPEDRPGLAFATALLIEENSSFHNRGAWAKVRFAVGLGTYVNWDVGERTTEFSSRGLGLFADWHVWRLFYLLDHSVFPAWAVKWMHKAADDAAQDPDQDVRSAALRERLFGVGHPYAGPALTLEAIRKIGKGDLERFRAHHYQARVETLVVAGHFELAQMKQEIEETFGTWDGGEPAAIEAVPAANPAKGPSWVGVTEPDATQAHVTIAFASRTDEEKDRAARMILSRLVDDRVRVVREGLGASYGVGVSYFGGEGGSALSIDGLLDPERGGDAVVAMLDELARLRDPATDLAEDFVRARRRALASALADTAGAADTAGELAFIGARQLDTDYLAALATAIGNTTLDDLRAAIRDDLAGDRMVVVVSGRAKVLDAIFAKVGVTVKRIDAR
jgi:zinc protease